MLGIWCQFEIFIIHSNSKQQWLFIMQHGNFPCPWNVLSFADNMYKQEIFERTTQGQCRIKR